MTNGGGHDLGGTSAGSVSGHRPHAFATAVLSAVGLAAALLGTGCGAGERAGKDAGADGSGPPPGARAREPERAGGSPGARRAAEKAAAARTTRAYYEKLSERLPSACLLTTQRFQDRIYRRSRLTCEEALRKSSGTEYTFRPREVSVRGDRATVRGRLVEAGNTSERTASLRKQGGRWRIDRLS